MYTVYTVTGGSGGLDRLLLPLQRKQAKQQDNPLGRTGPTALPMANSSVGNAEYPPQPSLREAGSIDQL